MASIANMDQRPRIAQNTSASGAASSVTIAASVDRSWSLQAIHITYSGGSPAQKAITITYTEQGAAKTVVIGVTGTALATNIVEIFGRICGDINTAITITGELLAAQTNTLDVFYN